MSKEIVYRTREEVLNLWVSALRSGKYRKCRYYLRKGSCFCALGVLVDLAVKDGGPKWRQTVGKIYVTGYGYGSSVSVPEEFTKFLNISFQKIQPIS